MKKRLLAAIVAVCIATVTAETIFSRYTETAYAQESFVGIDSVISSHNSSNPFIIVELVPDYHLAKLGYLVEGYEPYYYNEQTGVYEDYLKHLASLGSAAERTDFMSGLKTSLNKILNTSTSSTTVLSYEPYQESYSYVNGYQVLTLNKTEELSSGTSGYSMSYVGEGNGDYALDEKLLAMESGGDYNQNIVCYSKNPTEAGAYYYQVNFSAVSTESVEGQYAYVVERAAEIDPTYYDTWDNVYYRTSDGVYVKANSAADGNGVFYVVVFSYAQVVAPSVDTDETETETETTDSSTGNTGETVDKDSDKSESDSGADGDKTEGGGSNDKTDSDDTTDSNGTDSENGTDSADTVGDSNNDKTDSDDTAGDSSDKTDSDSTTDGNGTDSDSNSDKADSDSTADSNGTDSGNDTGKDSNANTVIYYQISGTPTFDASGNGTYGAVLDSANPYIASANGHFSKCYRSVKQGTGDYALSTSIFGSLDGIVLVDRIYYKGSFTNNNLFLSGVFNQDQKADLSNFPVQVYVMTPSAYTEYIASNGETDLLFISNSSAVSGASRDTFGTYADESNALSDEVVFELYEQIVSDETRLPVILDYSIVQDSSLDNTGVGKLARLLTAAELSESNVVRTVGADGSITASVADGLAAFAEPDGDHCFVNENVFVVPEDNASFQFLRDFDSKMLVDSRGGTESSFQKNADKHGFSDIAETIITENVYRTVENEGLGEEIYGLYDQMVTKAIATEFIISYVSRREAYEDTVFQVLDIEPCTITDETKAVIEKNIRKMLGIDEYSTNTVEVTHMSSAEFISKVEDLCAYDMIYMGLYTDYMNTEDGRTVYNDSDMNGLVYTNIGDIKEDTIALGLLDTNYANTAKHYTIETPDDSYLLDFSTTNYVRYSGNDLTEEKVTAIENFVKSGAPVVLADNFLTTNASGETCVYDFEYKKGKQASGNYANGYIDNCSRMYELIDTIRTKTNVMKEYTLLHSAAARKNLNRYISLGKPMISVIAQDYVEDQLYYKTSGSNITFDFTIKNYGEADANASFNCYLYADFNSDGRYSAAESIAANDFRITLNGVKQKAVYDEENQAYYYELSPTDGSEVYHLTYTLPSDYSGLVPVKIKVSQNSNSNRYDSDILYFKMDNTSGDAVKIKVLQIVTTEGRTTTSGMTVLGNRLYADDTGFRSIKSNSVFKSMLDELRASGEYDIQIDVVSDKKYASVYKSDPTFLDSYDMLILGFADMYDFLADKGSNATAVIEAYQGISDFIESGKSVLFTHDTTNFSSYAGEDKNWSFTLTQLLCPQVGFDRYGVYSSSLLSAGIKNLTSDDTSVYRICDYYSLVQAQKDGTIASGQTEITGAELFQMIVDEANSNNKDIAYKPNSGKTALVTEVQGRSSMQINTNGSSKKTVYSNVVGKVNGTQPTYKAELLNEGQILIYPFNILSDIRSNNNVLNIARTHGQYFQIDMNEDLDQDGESDITVWLTLKSGSDFTDQYSAAEYDARNNYYIYTKGNVTYSGVGHANMDYVGNEAEIKLYINTLVAAYNAGAHAPTITLKQTADSDSNNLKVLYTGMDSSVENGVVQDGELIDANGTERIYFTVDDINVALGTKKISVEYYLVFETWDDVPDGMKDQAVVLQNNSDTVYGVKQDWTTYRDKNETPETSLDNIISGVVYSCDVPCNILDLIKKNSSDIPNEATVWVKATTSIWRQNNSLTNDPSGTYTSYKSFTVQRIGLFDLD